MGKPIPAEALEAPVAAPQPSQTVAMAGPSFPQATVIAAPPLLNMNRPLQQQNPQAIGAELAAAAEAVEASLQDNKADSGDECANVEPVGREYIETRVEGKILSFFCKLCDCQFNDPNAKDMHMKGRRHRLAYKKKVDPSLRVDLKGPLKTKLNMRESRQLIRQPGDKPGFVKGANFGLMNKSLAPVASGGIKPLMGQDSTPPPQPQQALNQLMTNFKYDFIYFIKSLFKLNKKCLLKSGRMNMRAENTFFRHTESFDDRHMMARSAQIQQSQEELAAIQEIVTTTEKALKLVSDQIAEEDQKNEGKETNVPVANDEAET